MVGKLDADQIDALLDERRFAHLACHADSKTYVVPISYAYAGGRILGQTTLGLKVRMMRKNPDVCLVVDDVKSLTDWRSAVLWGSYHELEGLEAVDAMTHLIDRFGPVFEEAYSRNRLGRTIGPAIPDDAAAPVVVYAIDIKERSGRFERPDA